MNEDEVDEYTTPTDEVEEVTQPTRTYAVVDGHIRGMTDGLEAMRQAVGKILHTERFVWPIYDDQYGNDLLELIGKPMPYAENEVRRMTEDALFADDRINDVVFDSITVVSSDTLAVAITVKTIFGDVPAGMEVTTA